jgi:hypothetical protein
MTRHLPGAAGVPRVVVRNFDESVHLSIQSSDPLNSGAVRIRSVGVRQFQANACRSQASVDTGTSPQYMEAVTIAEAPWRQLW